MRSNGSTVGRWGSANCDREAKVGIGDAVAQYNLGLSYYKGVGIPRDYKEAVKWFRLAAEQGNGDAQVNLGVMFYQGQGVPAPPRQSERHFFQRPEHYKEAVKWFRLAAEQANAVAQVNLGFMYDKGLGVPQDHDEAVKWYLLAAAQGNANAEYNLGVAYQEGCGVPHNQDEAIKLYRLAAAHGSKEAGLALSHALPQAVRLPKFRSPALKISGKTAAINTVRIATSIMLFAALASQPRGYYEVLRIIVCGVAAYSAYLAFPSHSRWVWFFVICAALFNPFLPVYLHAKSVWAVIDVAVGIAFLVSAFAIRPKRQQCDGQRSGNSGQ